MEKAGGVNNVGLKRFQCKWQNILMVAIYFDAKSCLWAIKYQTPLWMNGNTLNVVLIFSYLLDCHKVLL